MDIRIKKNLIQQNIYACKFGIYRGIPISKTQKNFFTYNINIAPPYEYCNVEVNNAHIIDIAYQYFKYGYRPVILNIVSEDFIGDNMNSCEGYKDELIFIRTNINQTTNGFNLFPLKTEVAYAPIVHIIRNDNMQLVPPNQLGKISVISASIKKNPQLVNNNINIDDYTTCSQLLETIFQTAYLGGNDVLILGDFGCITDNYPVDDIIDIMNGCIYKYGHLFKNITVSIYVTSQATMGYYSKFSEKIVRPQSYLNEYMQTNLLNQPDNIKHDNIPTHMHVVGNTFANNQPNIYQGSTFSTANSTGIGTGTYMSEPIFGQQQNQSQSYNNNNIVQDNIYKIKEYIDCNSGNNVMLANQFS